MQALLQVPIYIKQGEGDARVYKILRKKIDVDLPFPFPEGTIVEDVAFQGQKMVVREVVIYVNINNQVQLRLDFDGLVEEGESAAKVVEDWCGLDWYIA